MPCAQPPTRPPPSPRCRAATPLTVTQNTWMARASTTQMLPSLSQTAPSPDLNTQTHPSLRSAACLDLCGKLENLPLPADTMSEETSGKKDCTHGLSPTNRKWTLLSHINTDPLTILQGELGTTIPALCFVYSLQLSCFIWTMTHSDNLNISAIFLPKKCVDWMNGDCLFLPLASGCAWKALDYTVNSSDTVPNYEIYHFELYFNKE